MIKRSFDVAIAAAGLICLSPLFLLVSILIKLNSTGPVFFRQERVGRGFHPFRIYKFRTMIQDAPRLGAAITSRCDPRITTVGRVLRRTKIDELPQLLNVLKGEMSLVGPRPEVRQYVDCLKHDYAEILQVRPGITDLASLKYRDEAEVLAAFGDQEEGYLRHILPDKIVLGKQYVRSSSLALDLVLIGRTILEVIGLHRVRVRR